jgi:hypothetical protein
MLALQVRNISQGEPLPKAATQTDNKHADYFFVDLDYLQVTAILEGLVACADNQDNRGLAIMAKSLIQDWTNLAHKMNPN